MHNGLKVACGSYYGSYMQQVLVRNRGVHEPQEERVFQEVLRFIPSSGTMIELGANWSFYSMWFMHIVPGAQCLMVEPDPLCLNCGRLNFLLNGFHGTFVHAFIGKQSHNIPYATPVTTVDELMEQHHIAHLHLLHSDIQGFELDMLIGARKALVDRMVDYIFISTHSNHIHKQCIEELGARGYNIVTEHDLDESYSVDGLIVARRAEIAGLDSCFIARNLINANI